jgi:hypothetical protein
MDPINQWVDELTDLAVTYKFDVYSLGRGEAQWRGSLREVVPSEPSCRRAHLIEKESK